MASGDYVYPLALSTLAGLSTTIGGAFAVIRKPDEPLLALFLGIAIGVMSTVSIVELLVKNALENDPLLVLGAFAAGAFAFLLIDPLFPKMDVVPDAGKAGSGQDRGDAAVNKGTHAQLAKRTGPRGASPTPAAAAEPAAAPGGGKRPPMGAASLIRLGTLMAVTMTLHNLPEGFAVAFSAFTPLGPIMALAIAAHNIPEGIIVAAPIYAATGSRWKAMGMATASGLSEPLGACIALFAVRPFLDIVLLEYCLSFVGGIMTAVCALELWPEGRKCRADVKLLQGIALGTTAMGWTLYVGV